LYSLGDWGWEDFEVGIEDDCVDFVCGFVFGDYGVAVDFVHVGCDNVDVVLGECGILVVGD